MERFRSLLSSENAEREIETDSPDFEPVETIEAVEVANAEGRS
jgi:hypothetical protein